MAQSQPNLVSHLVYENTLILHSHTVWIFFELTQVSSDFAVDLGRGVKIHTNLNRKCFPLFFCFEASQPGCGPPSRPCPVPAAARPVPRRVVGRPPNPQLAPPPVGEIIAGRRCLRGHPSASVVRTHGRNVLVLCSNVCDWIYIDLVSSQTLTSGFVKQGGSREGQNLWVKMVRKNWPYFLPLFWGFRPYLDQDSIPDFRVWRKKPVSCKYLSVCLIPGQPLTVLLALDALVFASPITSLWMLFCTWLGCSCGVLVFATPCFW